MHKPLIILILLVLAQVVRAQTATLTPDSVGQLDLLLLSFTTEDSIMPTCEYVSHPAGSFGNGITNETKVPGRLVISLKGDTLYDSGEYEKGVSGMTLKITGNSSAYKDPKPYKIKLQQKEDLLFRDNAEDYADKEWRLLRDNRTLHSVVGFKLSEMLGMPWTPQYKFCNVFINGEYQGDYMLIENVKRNTSGRINVTKKGFVVERDAYWWNESVFFKTNFFDDNRYGWTFKYPEDDEVTDAQINYIQQHLCEVEEAIDNGNYEDYIDVETFATWLLAHDILGTWDSGGSNLYITKRDNTYDSKLVMPCLWDFDSSRAVGSSSFSRYHYGLDFYFEKLMNNPNDLFSKYYVAHWCEIRDRLTSEMKNFLTEFTNTTTASMINKSRRFVADKYGYTYTTVASNVSTYRSWFNTHTKWLDEHIGGTNTITPVNDIYVDAKQSRTYNLQGIPVPDDTPGLVIKNGKLVKQ